MTQLQRIHASSLCIHVYRHKKFLNDKNKPQIILLPYFVYVSGCMYEGLHVDVSRLLMGVGSHLLFGS